MARPIFRDDQIIPPEKPLDEVIMPDAWLNIPMCIKEAFNRNSEFSNHLLAMIMSIISNGIKTTESIKKTKKELTDLIEKQKTGIKEDIVKIVNYNEKKVTGKCSDLKVEITDSNREIDRLKDNFK